MLLDLFICLPLRVAMKQDEHPRTEIKAYHRHFNKRDKEKQAYKLLEFVGELQ